MHKVGVAVVGLAIRKSQLCRLGDQVNVRRCIVPQGSHIEPFQQAELLQKDRSLAPGSTFEDLIAAVGGRYRRLHLGFESCQVIQVEQAPMASNEARYLVCDLSPIEKIPSSF